MWLPFRIPYRWDRPRTFCKNVWWIITDIRDGICNVFRWSKVIWFDSDYDWEYLAEVMEYKLRRMSKGFKEHGHHVNADLDAHRMLVCAELLKRLREDEYWQNAQIRFGKSTLAANHSQMVQKNDQKYLGVILGKYLNHWWD